MKIFIFLVILVIGIYFTYMKSKEEGNNVDFNVIAIGIVATLALGVASSFLYEGIISVVSKITDPPPPTESDESSPGSEDESDEGSDTESDTEPAASQSNDMTESQENPTIYSGPDPEEISDIQMFRDTIARYLERAEEAGDRAVVADEMEDCYSFYALLVLDRKAMMERLELSGGIYAQILSELNDAISLGEDLQSKGYSIDVSSLTDIRDRFDASYIESMMMVFNSFTERDMWSRTEAWNLMKNTADNMFDPADLDDPIRLRYAYALSWWIQKEIETELGKGMLTEKGAAIKIANLVEQMDYNPMMIDYYITYRKMAGEDCTEVENAYRDIVNHLARTQGIRIGENIKLDHFWYFNDFVNYPVDDKNGVTQENRQWIRERMKLVTFSP